MSNGFQWISSSPTDLASIKKEHARKCHVHTKHDHQDHENWSFSALITIMFIIFLKKKHIISIHFPLSFPNISPKEIDDWRHGAVGDHAQAVHGAQTHGVRETHPEGRHEGAILNDCGVVCHGNAVDIN